MNALFQKILPTLVISLIGAAATLWQDFILMKQDVTIIKTELARHEQEIDRARSNSDRQNESNSAVLDRLDALIESANRTKGGRK